jgi:glyoxylase-like metal-dependent hydrolase (beta-lactamase superfamily II)
VILFDTGYAPRFRQAVARFPECLCALATPVSVTAEETAAARLEAMGILKDDIRMVIFSHFHADHWGGAADFARATYVFAKDGYERLRCLSRWSALRAGFLPALLPPDLESRSLMLAPESFAQKIANSGDFDRGYDLFGDESLILLPLPGHAAGQVGALVREESGRRYFLIGDACWLEASYRRNLPPPSAVVRLLFDNPGEYVTTLRRIHEFSQVHQEIVIVPSHCPDTLARLPN